MQCPLYCGHTVCILATSKEKKMERAQMTDLIVKYGITIQSKRTIKLAVELNDSWKRDASKWRCTLTFGDRTISTSFWQGSAHNDAPTAADVLSSLCLDSRCGEMSYDEFASEMSGDKSTHRACQLTAIRMRAFLAEHREEFMSAEH